MVSFWANCHVNAGADETCKRFLFSNWYNFFYPWVSEKSGYNKIFCRSCEKSRYIYCWLIFPGKGAARGQKLSFGTLTPGGNSRETGSRASWTTLEIFLVFNCCFHHVRNMYIVEKQAQKRAMSKRASRKAYRRGYCVANNRQASERRWCLSSPWCSYCEKASAWRGCMDAVQQHCCWDYLRNKLLFDHVYGTNVHVTKNTLRCWIRVYWSLWNLHNILKKDYEYFIKIMFEKTLSNFCIEASLKIYRAEGKLKHIDFTASRQLKCRGCVFNRMWLPLIQNPKSWYIQSDGPCSCCSSRPWLSHTSLLEVLLKKWRNQ